MAAEVNRHKCGLNLDIYQPQIDVFNRGILCDECRSKARKLAENIKLHRIGGDE